MESFTLKVIFTGMMVFVPNETGNEMLVVIPTVHAHEGATAEDTMLEHRPRIRVSCANLEGCQGGGDHFIDLKGVDVSFRRNGKPLGRFNLTTVQGLRKPDQECPTKVDSRDLGWTVRMEDVLPGAGTVRLDLVRRSVPAPARASLAGRVRLTSGTLASCGFAQPEVFAFEPSLSSRAKTGSTTVRAPLRQAFATHLEWAVTLCGEHLELVLTPHDGSKEVVKRLRALEVEGTGTTKPCDSFFPESSIRTEKREIALRVENNPDPKLFEALMNELSSVASQKSDPHFRHHYQLTTLASIRGFSQSDLPIPVAVQPPKVCGDLGPPGDEQVICPKPTMNPSKCVSAETEDCK